MNRDDVIDYASWEKGGPHALVQWKGTDVCMDAYCKCGVHAHIHGDFVYAIHCRDCGAHYAVESFVRLLPCEGTADDPCTVEIGAEDDEDDTEFRCPDEQIAARQAEAVAILAAIHDAKVLPTEWQEEAWRALRRLGK